MVVPFNNVYKKPADFDATNPNHRLMDPDLGDMLLSPAVLSQFLTWLVQGAVQWYKGRLGDKPQLLRDAERAYVGENDVLGSFIATHCKVGKAERVDTTEFREAFQRNMDTKISAPAMKSKMEIRGFPLERKRLHGQSRGRFFFGVSLLC